MSEETTPRRGNRRRNNRRQRGGRRHNSNRNRSQNRSRRQPKKQGFFGWIMSLLGFGSSSQPERPCDTGEKSEERSEKRLQHRGLEIEQPEVTSEKLYVGNLPYEVSESDLFDLFANVGAVKNVEIVRDRESRSKGFGFVEMQSLETAQAASAKFHRSDLMGRPLVVSGAKS